MNQDSPDHDVSLEAADFDPNRCDPQDQETHASLLTKVVPMSAGYTYKQSRHVEYTNAEY